MAAMQQHQVIVVCGETGSGKTTQLPKMALALGRGKINQPAADTPPAHRARTGTESARARHPQRSTCGHLIGHTQPRRIAASSVARRLAQELRTAPGEVVGYKVRFHDTLAPGASVKLMTDGILLAETQSDPLLLAYDTLIIDEAHERSLNIDFLLGYIRQILPRRPDLKVIITSATIDAQRFADHFADARGRPAPVLTVSGRTYPVEIRWRPFEEKKDFDLNDAIADAVDELWAGGRGGDILVFLPGEREIREAADHLRRHLQHSPVLRSSQVLPLFARQSQADQDRIFDGHTGRRIVLATNVAETSLTVPGIHFVIDAGTARVKRYALRTKVEQLMVEPISQAAANQRAGRCGRVADGVCIRLYAEEDFQQRPAFTDPEILRSSLAGVILRMKSLGLGDVVNFPFLQAPSGRAIADGYQLLAELGAVDERGELLPLGRELARLPLDPRVGRMMLEARTRGALAEVLVIAAALSVQDVRDRPLHEQAQADQAHARFDDPHSEFSSYLRLWQWLHDARAGRAVAQTRQEMDAATARLAPPSAQTGSAPAAPTGPGPGAARPPSGTRARPQRSAAWLPVAQRSSGATPESHAPATAQAVTGPGASSGTTAAFPAAVLTAATAPDPQAGADATTGPGHKPSHRQWEQLLRRNYLNARRVREWRDIHSQLLTVAREHGWPLNTQPAGYEAIHLSLLCGLLGNIGYRAEEGQPYLGAHAIRFHPHPGAHLSRRPARWIVAAEQVQTTRLYGRGIAAIEPQWLETVGAHLLKKQLLDPHWSKKQADVVARERATLHGLVLYNDRRVSYGHSDPATARDLFIRHALMEGDWDTRWPFLGANLRTVRRVQELEHKSRRQDVLVDEALIHAFYDQHLPAHVYSGATFDAWFCTASRTQPDLLRLSREELMRHEAAGITTEAFPRTIRLGGVDCTASYLHSPGDARDGLTVTVPLFVLNQVSEARCEWLVPGMLRDKIAALLKSLPQRPRSRFVPLPESAQRLADHFSDGQRWAQGSLMDALLAYVREHTALDVRRSDFKPDMLSAHHFMNLRVIDGHGRQLGQSRNIAALKAELGSQARGAFQALAALKARPGTDSRADPGAATQPPAPTARPARPAKDCGPRPADRHAKADGPPALPDAQTRYTTWSFGELPELMEIRQGSQSLIGFPALIDCGDAVRIEVFDEPATASHKHRAGLRRLCALHIRDALKYLEKNIPDLQKMAVAYMPLGTLETLRTHIIERALDRAFLQEPLPQNAADFERRIQEGRSRLTLIASEIARLCGTILQEYAAVQRKIRDSKYAAGAVADIGVQLQQLMPGHFVATTPWEQLAHFPRYLKAITARLEKYRSDSARDQAHQKTVALMQQRYLRLLAERKGQADSRMQEYRWMVEELRVSLFAQELRTPYPVSPKRLDKVWAQIQQ